MRFYLAIMTTTVLLTGCETNKPISLFSGTVRVIAGTGDSETSVNGKLTDDGRVRGGLKFDGAKPDDAIDWEVDVDWSKMAVRDSTAIYRFNWTLVEFGTQYTGTSDIAFDGENRVVSAIDDHFSIAIDPRSLHSGMSPEGTPYPNPRPGPIWAE